MGLPIALQLYSVREDAEKDLFGVLKQVASFGYDGVEFAGYYGHSAADIKKIYGGNTLRLMRQVEKVAAGLQH